MKNKFSIIISNIILDCSSISSFNQVSRYPSSSSIQINQNKNEPNNTGFLSATGRSTNDRLGLQNTLHVGTTNTFTARNTATLFSETVPTKQLLEQIPSQQQQQSAFRRPLSGQENNSLNQSRSSTQNLLISQTPQKSMQNGLINEYQQQSSNVITSRPSMLSDSYSCMSIR
jgi:hypothetical protein